MKTMKISSSDWLRIGTETGWIKEAGWFSPKYTPGQQQLLQNKQDAEQSMLNHVQQLEEYIHDMEFMHDSIASASRVLQSNPVLLQYLTNFQDGDRLKAQLENVQKLEDSFRVGVKFLQGALQQTIRTGKPIEKLQAPATPEVQPPSPQTPPPVQSVDEPYVFECPNCQQPIEGQSSMAGAEIECPTCKQPFITPSVTPESLARAKTTAAPPEVPTPDAQSVQATPNPPAANEPAPATDVAYIVVKNPKHNYESAKVEILSQNPDTGKTKVKIVSRGPWQGTTTTLPKEKIFRTREDALKSMPSDVAK
jgi:hypothetical protein